MAQTDVQICNMALAHLGHSGPFISDLETDQSQEAETCNVFWDTVRDDVLGDYPWPFATAKKELAQIADQERDGWDYAFALPDDCVSPRFIWPADSTPRKLYPETRTPYKIAKHSEEETSILLCDIDNPVLEYTARMSNVAAYPSKFAMAMSYKMAEMIAIPITGDANKRREMRALYRAEVGQAEARAMNEQQEDEEPETPSLRARR